jgi:hypothetical protein
MIPSSFASGSVFRIKISLCIIISFIRMDGSADPSRGHSDISAPNTHPNWQRLCLEMGGKKVQFGPDLGNGCEVNSTFGLLLDILSTL